MTVIQGGNTIAFEERKSTKSYRVAANRSGAQHETNKETRTKGCNNERRMHDVRKSDSAYIVVSDVRTRLNVDDSNEL